MTAPGFSLEFCGCFVALLIWVGCTPVVCLVDDKLEAQPTAKIDYNSTGTIIANATYGDNTLPFPCFHNSPNCVGYCMLCNIYFGEPTMDCLSLLYDNFCLHNFTEAMASLNHTDWCSWGKVSSLYSNLSHCTEEISDCLFIPWPNTLVEQTFVEIHSKYFEDCPSEELSDPPPAIVFALVITPICLIPVMVSLVVLKTKNGDGSS